MAKKTDTKKLPFILAAGVVVVLGVVLAKNLISQNNSNAPSIIKPKEESFEAPGKDWPSSKKVEDYFVSNLHMSSEEAQNIRSKPGVDGKVMVRLTAETTIDGLVGNLEYYGFVRDKDTLLYALEHATDTVPGRTDAMKVGNNTVDKYAYYRISENMTAWEIANELLNNPTYFAYDEYRYLFMP